MTMDMPRVMPMNWPDLRHACQKLISDLGGKLLPQPASYTRGDFLDDRAYYAGLWHDSPVDTIAFYREILKSKPVDGAWTREMLFRTLMVHQPYLDGDGTPFTQSKRNFGPPWIVAWQGPAQVELKTLWQNFLKELAASPDPVLQADALKFEMASDYTKEARVEVADRFVALLKSHPDCISGPRGNEFVTGLLSLYFGINSEKSAAAYSDLVDLYVNLFKERVILPTEWINEIQGLAHGGNPDAIKSLLAGVRDYASWYPIKIGNDWGTQCAVKNALHAIYLARPELAVSDDSTPGAPPLTVNRYWDEKPPSRSDPSKLREQGVFVDTRTFVAEGNTLWFLTEEKPHRLYGVDTSNFQTVFTSDFPAQYDAMHSTFPSPICFLEVTPQWLVVTIRGQVLFSSRVNKLWNPIDVPLSNYRPRWVNQQLYLLFDAVGERMSMRDPNNLLSASSGLIKVSLPEATCETLVNSRRVPPQSALDGQPLGTAQNLWRSQAGLTMAFASLGNGFHSYATPFGKNDWSPLLSIPDPCSLTLSSGGAIIRKGITFSGNGQIFWSDQNGQQLILSKGTATGSDIPTWNTPADLHLGAPLVRRGEDFCAFADFKDTTGPAQPYLYYFAKGQKDGVKIPLNFDLSKLTNPQLTKTPNSRAGLGNFYSTDFGAVIGEISAGFWLIPWSDIDAYRAKAGPGAKPATAPTSTSQ